MAISKLQKYVRDNFERLWVQMLYICVLKSTVIKYSKLSDTVTSEVSVPSHTCRWWYSAASGSSEHAASTQHLLFWYECHRCRVYIKNGGGGGMENQILLKRSSWTHSGEGSRGFTGRFRDSGQSCLNLLAVWDGPFFSVVQAITPTFSSFF